jgi:hypothetical protein
MNNTNNRKMSQFQDFNTAVVCYSDVYNVSAKLHNFVLVQNRAESTIKIFLELMDSPLSKVTKSGLTI